MKAFNTSLALTALALSILATPALAKTQHQSRDVQDYVGAASAQPMPEHYPNGALKSGTAQSFQSGAEFDQGS